MDISLVLYLLGLIVVLALVFAILSLVVNLSSDNKNRYNSKYSNRSKNIADDDYSTSHEQQIINPQLHNVANDNLSFELSSSVYDKENVFSDSESNKQSLNTFDFIETREHSEGKDRSSRYDESSLPSNEHSSSSYESNWSSVSEPHSSGTSVDSSYNSFDSGSISSTDSFSGSSSGSSE